MMSSQLFKKPISIDILITLLNKISKIKENYKDSGNKVVNYKFNSKGIEDKGIEDKGIEDKGIQDKENNTCSDNQVNYESDSNNIDTDYYIDNILYKKLIYNNFLTPFLEEVKSYYFPCKKYYAERDMNYSKFLTIVRQICNHNNVLYTKKILYVKNTYEIVYNIYPFEHKNNENCKKEKI